MNNTATNQAPVTLGASGSAGKLSLQGVDKFYGKGTHAVHAVKSLSMDVNAGEIVALLGSSGCGKTSTLRMIAGFEAVSAGAILVNGQPIHQLRPAQRNVAMAFEGYSLYPPLTVRENIEFALKAARLSKADTDRRVAEIAHLLEIESLMDRYPVSISGGQQQRASLARALIRDADLHLLDEPMGQLEPQLRAILRGRIKHFIKERGLTAILVTHDQVEANALADRIAVMEDGALQQLDTPDQLKARPSNLFSGTFIGEPPMNVYPATVNCSADSVTFELGDNTSLTYRQSEFSEGVRQQLQQQTSLVVGVRPYAVKRVADGAQATVVANQWLGDQTHISAEFAGTTLVLVEHDQTRLDPGQHIAIAIAAEDLHLFDKDSGNAIAHGGALAS
jgi:multiple sugar transport system ATP-binding protein